MVIPPSVISLVSTECHRSVADQHRGAAMRTRSAGIRGLVVILMAALATLVTVARPALAAIGSRIGALAPELNRSGSHPGIEPVPAMS